MGIVTLIGIIILKKVPKNKVRVTWKRYKSVQMKFTRRF